MLPLFLWAGWVERCLLTCAVSAPRIAHAKVLTLSVYCSFFLFFSFFKKFFLLLLVYFPHLSGEGFGFYVSWPPPPSLPSPPDLNCKLVIAVVPAGPEQQAQDQSVPRRTSTARARSQWSLPDPNSKPKIRAFCCRKHRAYKLSFNKASFCWRNLEFSLILSSVGEVDKKGTREKWREGDKFRALVHIALRSVWGL